VSDTEKCVHGMRVCSRCVVITDAAKRIADNINLRIAFTPWEVLVRSCMTFRLDDGSTDGTFYSSRKVALTWQTRPSCVFYFRNCPGGVGVRDIQIWLNMQRAAFESDRIAWIDPESPDLIISTRSGDILRGRRAP
jgi:hypothetical protein